MRRWRDEDRAPYAAMNADTQVMRYFPATMSRADSDAHVDRIQDQFSRLGFGLWALEVTQTGQFIGFTGLSPVPEEYFGSDGFEVGWRLAAHAWHQGYATEAANAALDVGFSGVGLDLVWSFTSVLNTPSVAVMRRIGMSEHGFFEHPRIEPGHPLRRHVLYLADRRIDGRAGT
jgi:RimJ/RimL family protein N-acetyltransferase